MSLGQLTALRDILVSEYISGRLLRLLLTASFLAIGTTGWAEDPLDVLRAFRTPVILQHAGMYKDGGTRFVELVDASSHTLTFCLDGRLHVWQSSQAPPKIEPQIFLAAHPTTPDARALKIGGADEKRIFDLLQNWKSSGSPMAPPQTESAYFTTSQVYQWQREHVDLILRTLGPRHGVGGKSE
jgi:hypothetical protein